MAPRFYLVQSKWPEKIRVAENQLQQMIEVTNPARVFDTFPTSEKLE